MRLRLKPAEKAPEVIHGEDGRDGVDGLPGEKGIPGRDGVDGKDGLNGSDGRDGADGVPGRDGVNGLDGKDGQRGLRGYKGIPGRDGSDGWTPVLAAVPDGERVVQRVIQWVGGTGNAPESGFYVGRNGFVTDPASATDIRGPAGKRGETGLVGGGGALIAEASNVAFVPIMIDGELVYQMEGVA